MLKSGFFAGLLALVFVLGCGASAQQQAQGPADASRAWDRHAGKCVKTSGEADYTACLEQQLQNRNEHPYVAPRPKASAPQPVAPQAPAVPSPAATAPAPVEPTPAATASPVPPAPPPPPPPQVMPHTVLSGGRVMWVPVASGAYCSSAESLILEVSNESDDFVVEVSGGKVVPLNCDSDRFIPARVMRRNGAIETTWVIPPHTTARLVFLPLNGGLGEVLVNFEAFLNLGPSVPAPAVGYMSRTFEVPIRGRTEKHHEQRVMSSLLRMYK